MKKSVTESQDVLEASRTKAADSHPSSVRQLRMGQALLETTWRTTIPVVIFTGLGIYADLHIGSKPWLTLLGVIIGFILAGVLIARLLQESENM